MAVRQATSSRSRARLLISPAVKRQRAAGRKPMRIAIARITTVAIAQALHAPRVEAADGDSSVASISSAGSVMRYPEMTKKT
jgi:hypothetical protein